MGLTEGLDGSDLISVGLDGVGELHEEVTTLVAGDTLSPDGVVRLLGGLTVDGSLSVGALRCTRGGDSHCEVDVPAGQERQSACCLHYPTSEGNALGKVSLRETTYSARASETGESEERQFGVGVVCSERRSSPWQMIFSEVGSVTGMVVLLTDSWNSLLMNTPVGNEELLILWPSGKVRLAWGTGILWRQAGTCQFRSFATATAAGQPA